MTTPLEEVNKLIEVGEYLKEEFLFEETQASASYLSLTEKINWFYWIYENFIFRLKYIENKSEVEIIKFKSSINMLEIVKILNHSASLRSNSIIYIDSVIKELKALSRLLTIESSNYMYADNQLVTNIKKILAEDMDWREKSFPLYPAEDEDLETSPVTKEEFENFLAKLSDNGDYQVYIQGDVTAGDKIRDISTEEKPKINKGNKFEQKEINKVKFRDLLVNIFSVEELEDLCFRLHVDDEEFGTKNKTTLARKIVTHFKNHRELKKLYDEALAMRPNSKDEFLACLE